MLVLNSNVGPVARLVLNRPTAGNSLSLDLVSELRSNLSELAACEDIKVIILSGAGGRIFCAGHDLNEFAGQAADFKECGHGQNIGGPPRWPLLVTPALASLVTTLSPACKPSST